MNFPALIFQHLALALGAALVIDDKAVFAEHAAGARQLASLACACGASVHLLKAKWAVHLA